MNFWDLLRRLRQGQVGQNDNLPWIVYDDFNEILFSFEKRGGLPHNEARMTLFRDVLAYYGLHDAGYTGAWFMWMWGNLPRINIRERLDLAVINDSWLEFFPFTQVRHLVHSYSDHCP